MCVRRANAEPDDRFMPEVKTTMNKMANIFRFGISNRCHYKRNQKPPTSIKQTIGIMIAYYHLLRANLSYITPLVGKYR
jgi:hypothetical protein